MISAAAPETAMLISSRAPSVSTRLAPVRGRVTPMRVDAEDRGVDAEGEDLGVGEVDEAQDAVDERVAEGDQRIDRAEGQPVDRLGKELMTEGAEVELDRKLPSIAEEGARRDALLQSGCLVDRSTACRWRPSARSFRP